MISSLIVNVDVPYVALFLCKSSTLYLTGGFFFLFQKLTNAVIKAFKRELPDPKKQTYILT